MPVGWQNPFSPKMPKLEFKIAEFLYFLSFD